MLQEMGMPLAEPMVIFEDNHACIAMAIGENASAKLKHIDLRYQHFARLMVEEKKVKLVYCPTHHQAADILTKPTDTLLTFHRHRAHTDGHSQHHQLSDNNGSDIDSEGNNDTQRGRQIHQPLVQLASSRIRD